MGVGCNLRAAWYHILPVLLFTCSARPGNVISVDNITQRALTCISTSDNNWTSAQITPEMTDVCL